MSKYIISEEQYKAADNKKNKTKRDLLIKYIYTIERADNYDISIERDIHELPSNNEWSQKVGGDYKYIFTVTDNDKYDRIIERAKELKKANKESRLLMKKPLYDRIDRIILREQPESYSAKSMQLDISIKKLQRAIEKELIPIANSLNRFINGQ
ncbi:hypothetical protein NC796_07535 [Aliifodinibius sp. S!AR15-10]|uniref:hypothetical protein n=1 Tax=Aliifodinibius sp. S!AR15-10 TaxID=2950437 RepID=UPI002863D8D5|nr:hypothetical protein [Aliifodinibius sp. S!AR15-10]MDR8390984.1 hypothetical protein [Aliifodinibius sp. S!AR15-10]